MSRPGRWYPFLRCPYGAPNLLRDAVHAYAGHGCLFVHPQSESAARALNQRLPRNVETYADMPSDRCIVIDKAGEVSELQIGATP